MDKQRKPRKRAERIGKGKITPVQVAFIVDRYLSDNSFNDTRSTFRTEASDLISGSPVQEAPKSLLSLGAMLDEYICLKEQKVILDQEKCHLEHERFRVQMLLRGMQDAMNSFIAGGAATALPPIPTVKVPQKDITAMPPARATTPLPLNPPIQVPEKDTTVMPPAAGMPVTKTPVVRSTSRLSRASVEPTNSSTPATGQTAAKRRRNLKDVSSAPSKPKRFRNKSSPDQMQAADTTPLPPNQEAGLQVSVVPSVGAEPNKSLTQGSDVAKCLFNQPSNQSLPNPSVPQTPSPSQNDKSISPMEIPSPISGHNVTVTPQQFTSTNCTTVISSDTITVSPSKQISYYSFERNHCISSPIKINKRLGKRDHVKGRLDFGPISTMSDMEESKEILVPSGIVETQHEKQGDIFDFDLPNLDALGVDFSLTELLSDLDFHNDYCHQTSASSPESLSGSPGLSESPNMGETQVFSGYSSTVTQVLSEKDMNIPEAPDSVVTVKSIRKCIKIISPVKNRQSPHADQES